jgi:hypothetical protein
MSNDAWGIGRKPLRDIVDFELDNDTGTLWVVTRDAGAFKILVMNLQ